MTRTITITLTVEEAQAIREACLSVARLIEHATHEERYRLIQQTPQRLVAKRKLFNALRAEQDRYAATLIASAKEAAC